ncbi:hypothetical protein D3C74_208350 [compost metagenome]
MSEILTHLKMVTKFFSEPIHTLRTTIKGMAADFQKGDWYNLLLKIVQLLVALLMVCCMYAIGKFIFATIVHHFDLFYHDQGFLGKTVIVIVLLFSTVAALAILGGKLWETLGLKLELRNRSEEFCGYLSHALYYVLKNYRRKIDFVVVPLDVDLLLNDYEPYFIEADGVIVYQFEVSRKGDESIDEVIMRRDLAKLFSKLHQRLEKDRATKYKEFKPFKRGITVIDVALEGDHIGIQLTARTDKAERLARVIENKKRAGVNGRDSDF